MLKKDTKLPSCSAVVLDKRTLNVLELDFAWRERIFPPFLAPFDVNLFNKLRNVYYSYY